MAKDTRSPSAGRDSGAETGPAARGGATGAAAASAAAEAAGGSTLAASATGATGAGTVPASDPLAPNPDAAGAAAAALVEGRPQDAARDALAAAGSSLDAPGVGSGPAGEAARLSRLAVEGGAPVAALGEAGVRPGVFSREGAFGAAPELAEFGQDVPEIRRARLGAALRRQPYTGERMAVPRPATPEALADYAAIGFDLEITARQRGFRRAGVAHPVDPTLRRSTDFTVDELKALVAEPMLIVTALHGDLAGDD